jgi:glycosyltransferase involved in cell wall biosynthesis
MSSIKDANAPVSRSRAENPLTHEARRSRQPSRRAAPEGQVSCVVIIPTYNNADAAGAVIRAVSTRCHDIIVIDDGSTDTTPELLGEFDAVQVITFDANRGKGAALRAGLDEARSRGFTHAITIDADGQHYPEDIPLFLAACLREPDTLWIGNREIPVEGSVQPPRSRFGRWFGNFWFRYNTGFRIHDTQCGFRAYPLAALENLTFRGVRYEFEQEVLIKAAWNGTSIKEIPIHLYYEPAARRVSHFRPFVDFLRISAVNARAAFIKSMFPMLAMEVPGDNWRQKLMRVFTYELKAHATPRRAAASLAAGVFMGIFPIHGFQVATLMGLSVVCRLNRPLAFVGVCISSPPLLPFIIVAAVWIGRFFVPGDLSANVHGVNAAIVQGAAEFIAGSAILAALAGATTFFAAYPFFSALARQRRKKA